ncbi:MAG: hypothetical protein ABIV07_04715 [Polaromonas sp.]
MVLLLFESVKDESVAGQQRHQRNLGPATAVMVSYFLAVTSAAGPVMHHGLGDATEGNALVGPAPIAKSAKTRHLGLFYSNEQPPTLGFQRKLH